MGEIRDTRSDSRPNTVCLEGNGSRPSHRGDGWRESDVMYTLNSTEVHTICYGMEPGAAKRMNPQNRRWFEKSPTLRSNAGDNQVSVVICYGVCGYWSKGMLSDNPHVGFYEAKTTRTIGLNGGDPSCNQGGVCIVELHVPKEP